ncbi:MAG: D-alanyl-D-alanine carboxypeptidase family protein, partial [Candidatus Binatia bacterium]
GFVFCLLSEAASESAVRSSSQSRQTKSAVSAKRSPARTVQAKKAKQTKRPKVRKARKVRRAVRGRAVKRRATQPAKAFEAVLLQDAETGQILRAQESDKQWPAASLTKLMVGLLVLEAIEHGRLSLDTPVVITRRASHAGGRTINLRAGQIFPLDELLRAMIVTSANDASVAIAERLEGSVEACALAMNKRAQELGMSQSRFQTPNGMPLRDGTAADVSSATDMAILTRALLRYPQILQWTALDEVPFRGGQVMLPNTNRLVKSMDGVDGLKTGFTSKARYNLVATAQRGQTRLIAVVLGAPSSGTRFRTAANLLEWGFENFTRLRLIEEGASLGSQVRVEHGSVSTLQPIAASDAVLLVPKSEAADLHISLQVPSTVSAPISRHQILGGAVVQSGTRILTVIPALSPWDIPEVRWFPAQH